MAASAPKDDIDQKMDRGQLGVSVTEMRRKADTDSPDSIRSKAMELEDEFVGMYFTETNREGAVIQPPYDMRRLRRFTQENNTLLQAITAMEVNIDSTGQMIEIVEGEQVKAPGPNDPISTSLMEFLREPWPMMSFTSLRRVLRRDMEETGNAYLEVLRNPSREIVFVKRVDPTTVRLVRLSDPVEVEKRVNRGGAVASTKVMERQRRYIQKVGTRTVYFKDYGVSRDLNKNNGEFVADKGTQLAAQDRATELIHFTVVKDTETPYGVPRWINNLPSVLGSRRAEELNLEYFDAGGVPPVVVFVKGGSMANEVRQHLQNLFVQGAKGSLRAAVVEIFSSEGTMDGGAPSVDVQVERFGTGDAADADAQFQNYDERTSMRVRTAFRLPPIFLGLSEDYSFATAFASYTVAEAQVFAPERGEFDEIINSTIFRELSPDPRYQMRSLPLQVNDAVTQMEAVTIAANNGAISGEDLISTLNEIANLNLTYTEMELVDQDGEDNLDDDMDDFSGAGATDTPGEAPDPGGPSPTRRSAKRARKQWRKKNVVGAEDLVALAMRYLNAGAEVAKGESSSDWVVKVFADVDSLGATQRAQFQALLSRMTLPDVDHDPDFDALLTQAVGCVGHDHPA